MYRQQFFLGRETLNFSASECAYGVLLERDWRPSAQRSAAPEVRQVTIATRENLDALLTGEVRESVVRPRVEQMVSDLAGAAAENSAEELHGITECVRAIRAIRHAPDEGALAVQALAIARGLGARNCLFMLKDGREPSSAESSYRILTTSPEDVAAVRTYTEKHWFATDPFLIHACRSHEPCYSSDVGLLHNLTGSWREMGQFVRQLGMCSFAVLPAHAPRVDKIGALYVSNPQLPSEQGEEPFRENEVLLRALSSAVFDWYVSRDRYCALRQSGLNPVELSILAGIGRGETTEMVCRQNGLSKISFRTRYSPAIRRKLSARTIIEASRIADERGLLAAVSERKVGYVVHSPTWGTFLREECGVPFWSGVNPSGIATAQLFPDAASATGILERQPSGHDCSLHRVEIHHAALFALREDCVASGLPSWDIESQTSGSPLDDSATWGELDSPAGDYH